MNQWAAAPHHPPPGSSRWRAAAKAAAIAITALLLTAWVQDERGRVAIAVPTLVAFLWLARSWRRQKVHAGRERDTFAAYTQLQMVIDGMRDAVLVLDPAGRIELANAATTRLLGQQPDDLNGRDIATVLELDPAAQRSDPLSARLGLSAETGSANVVLRRVARDADGRPIALDVSLAQLPHRDGHVVAALREDRVHDDHRPVDGPFVATLSHEMRTPLTSVIGSLALLRGDLWQLPPTAQRLVEIADSNAQRLIRLLNDLLDSEAAHSRGLPLVRERIELAPLARRAVDDASGLAAATGGVTLRFTDCDAPLWIDGDGPRLLQVLGNLLSNAIRFSPPGGEVHLWFKRRSARAVLCIDDQGAGVPEAFRARIFQRFQQSDAGAAIAGGSGLGLAISREIVKAHGGDIWLDSGSGGARFCVGLPLLDASQGLPQAA